MIKLTCNLHNILQHREKFFISLDEFVCVCLDLWLFLKSSEMPSLPVNQSAASGENFKSTIGSALGQAMRRIYAFIRTVSNSWDKWCELNTRIQRIQESWQLKNCLKSSITENRQVAHPCRIIHGDFSPCWGVVFTHQFFVECLKIAVCKFQWPMGKLLRYTDVRQNLCVPTRLFWRLRYAAPNHWSRFRDHNCT